MKLKKTARAPTPIWLMFQMGNNISWFYQLSYNRVVHRMRRKPLVNISRVDNAFLASMVGLRPERYFWLGLSNQKNLDQFVWTNTDSVKFTHWNVDMPGKAKRCNSILKTQGINSSRVIYS